MNIFYAYIMDKITSILSDIDAHEYVLDNNQISDYEKSDFNLEFRCIINKFYTIHEDVKSELDDKINTDNSKINELNFKILQVEKLSIYKALIFIDNDLDYIGDNINNGNFEYIYDLFKKSKNKILSLNERIEKLNI